MALRERLDVTGSAAVTLTAAEAGEASAPERLRVLLLSMHFIPEPCDVRTSQLAAGLARRGHQATVLTSFPNYPYGKIYPGFRQKPWSREEFEGAVVFRVPMFPDHSRSLKRRALSYLSFMSSTSLFGPLLTRRPDVMWIHHPPLTTGIVGAMMARIKRTPFVFEVQDIWPESLFSSGMVLEGRLTKAVERVCQHLYRRAAAVVVPSDGMKQRLVDKGVPAAKVEVIYNWADEEVYRPLPRDPSLGVDHGLDGKFNVIFAGNVGIFQALDALVDAADILRDREDIQFVVLGDGVDLPRIRALAEERKLENIKFLGHFPAEEMPRFFAWADALLIHLRAVSVFDTAIPSKTQSYLACGRPIICAMNGDAARLVQEAGAGITCPPEAPQELADAVRRLAEMQADEREELGCSGRRTFEERFSKRVIIRRYEELFDRVRTKRLGRHR